MGHFAASVDELINKVVDGPVCDMNTLLLFTQFTPRLARHFSACIANWCYQQNMHKRRCVTILIGDIGL
jgi:hypothetical protein